MTSATPALIDLKGFFDRAAASGLFTPGQRAKAEASLPAGTASAPLAAQALVGTGFLTRFQAERLLAGRTDGFVLGQYVIEEPIGRGPMGRVYRARHRTMNRPVAVKVLAPELTRTSEARQAFRDGVRAAARLTHQNVVTTYDANEVGDRFYIVLEYVDGPSLQGLVEQRGPLPAAEACDLIGQAARGLQHAHEQGMAHHNLTPGNILVARPAKGAGGNVVKITDFRLSRTYSTELNDGLGQTPPPPALAARQAYTAPEQASGFEADMRADLYSLGAVFHFLLTGRPPFGLTYSLGLAPGVPMSVASIVHALLARDPDARIQTAADLIGRLEALSAAFAAGAERTAINFDLPASNRIDALTGGYLTGIPEPELSPWADIVAPTLGPAAGDTHGDLDEEGTTPITLRTVVPDRPTQRLRPTKLPSPARGVSPVVLMVVAGSMILLCLLAIARLMHLAA